MNVGVITSKTNLVNSLVYFRPPVVRLWCFMPPGISNLCLKIFKNN